MDFLNRIRDEILHELDEVEKVLTKSVFSPNTPNMPKLAAPPLT
jgi:hypothetical protein